MRIKAYKLPDMAEGEVPHNRSYMGMSGVLRCDICYYEWPCPINKRQTTPIRIKRKKK